MNYSSALDGSVRLLVNAYKLCIYQKELKRLEEVLEALDKRIFRLGRIPRILDWQYKIDDNVYLCAVWELPCGLSTTDMYESHVYIQSQFPSYDLMMYSYADFFVIQLDYLKPPEVLIWNS